MPIRPCLYPLNFSESQYARCPYPIRQFSQYRWKLFYNRYRFTFVLVLHVMRIILASKYYWPFRRFRRRSSCARFTVEWRGESEGKINEKGFGLTVYVLFCFRKNTQCRMLFALSVCFGCDRSMRERIIFINLYLNIHNNFKRKTLQKCTLFTVIKWSLTGRSFLY